MYYRLKLIMMSSILGLGLIGLVFLIPYPAKAQTFNPGCDSAELINAINLANANNEADVINLPDGCVYNLNGIDNTHPERGNTGLPLITTSITINGHGSTIRRESGGDYRLIFITTTQVTTGDLTLNNITLANGNVPDQGGAILNYYGYLTLKNSTLINNQADEGGAINNNDGATTTIINSTITSNTATTAVGGILNISVPPNLPNFLTIVNSTISHNGGATFSFSNGLENHGWGAFAVMTNTILANNEFSDCADSDDGFLLSGGNNLIETNFNCSFAESDINTPPKLGPLQDNGGDTLTRALLEDSPAIDAGNNTDCPTTDQRGISRPLDGNGDNTAICDIGAVEAPGSPAPTVQFSQAAYTANEGVGTSQNLVLTRTGNLTGTSQVQVSFNGGTASAGSDYSSTGFPKTITFGSGVVSRTVAISITNDTADEPLETILLSLSSLSNAVIGAQSSATLQLEDNDPAAAPESKVYLPLVVK